MNDDTIPIDNNTSQNPTVGSTSKEIAPDYSVNHAAESLKIQEIEQEIEKTKEMESIGAEIISGEVKLPPTLTQAGVQSVSGANTPIVTSQTPGPTMPITDDQIETGLHTDMGKSLHWLAVWCVKKLQQTHVILKKVHGHAVRILLRK